MKLKRPLYGGETGGDVLAVQRALNKWAVPKVAIPVTKTYDKATQARMQVFQADSNIRPSSGDMGQRSLDALWPFFDAYGKMRYRTYRAVSPLDVGPIVKGDRSLLDHAPTHDTGGIPLFPAVDLAWGAGVEMIAPEACVVDTRDTSASPGNAVYLTGNSKLRYWVGHIDRDHPLGTKLRKGQLIGRTVPQSDPKKNHGHVGINAEFYLGDGREFLWGGAPSKPQRRYQTGSPSYRVQLEEALL